MAAKKPTAAPGTAQHMAAERKGGAKPEAPLPRHGHGHGRDQLMHRHGKGGAVTRHSH